MQRIPRVRPGQIFWQAIFRNFGRIFRFPFGNIETLLEDIHNSIYSKAESFRKENTHTVDTYDEFKDVIENKGGFVYAHWDGTAETEEKIKEETKATIRCIPLDYKEETGNCIFSGKPSKGRVVFAKAY